MTLSQLPTYPSTRCYVLKLHRDARLAEGQLSGRLEHVSSGDSLPFDSGPALLNALLVHASGLGSVDSEGKGSSP